MDERLTHAAPGTLQPQTLADLIALRKFSEAQISSFNSLWGARLPSSRAREHLLRLIVIEFGFARLRQRAFYAEILTPLFAADEITLELSRLESVGSIIPGAGGELAPSQQVVDWYNRVMPIVMDEVSHVIKSR